MALFKTILAAALLAVAPLSQAQWPEKPIRLVVPYVAGAMGDVVARLLTESLRAELGQAVLVDNRAGAGGNIGAKAVEQSAPDGYTLLVPATNNLVINQFLYKDMGYDPLKRFEPVTILVDVPSVLFVPAALPVRSFGEFTAFARANPGKVNYASPGSGTTPHLAAESINRAFGLGMTHVPYKGASQAVAALLAGEVQFYLVGAGVGMPHVRSGKLRALAVSNERRLETIADVPTFAEAGITGIQASNWWGVVAPAGTPRPVIERLRGALCKTLAEPATRNALAQMGNVPVCNSTADMARQLANEAAYWKRTIADMNVKVE